MPKTWYNITETSDTTTAVRIHDEIGRYGVSGKAFMADWTAIPKENKIELSVHSPGGDVMEAFAIYHTILRDRARTTARIEGWAASAASYVIMAAGKIIAPKNAWLMIHNPWSWAVGEAKDMRKEADILEGITNSLVDIYHERTGKDPAEIAALLDAETWLTGEQALAAGFVDEVAEPLAIAASISSAAAKHLRAVSDKMPEEVRAQLERQASAEEAEQDTAITTDDENTDDEASSNGGGDGAATTGSNVVANGAAQSLRAEAIVAACADAGFPFMALSLVEEQADQQRLNEALADAESIVAICRAGGQPEAAENLIIAGIPVAEAAGRLIKFRASSAPTISSANTAADEFFTLPASNEPTQPTSGKRLNARAIYNQRGTNRA